ncbi:D-tagatose-bisphosphate aldolase, class II, non-catalytic subunit [Actibacterium lipolyticum]|uniref:D-tagatose-1,6-bisphosphate aldolase subunit KbaZ n=1 Tax=Actibacterium lipolyticum TaxID=1524263 RepID=A0A238JU44_9RHOB|nr:D-tagatose-bisphosphate aldolase, class II, non-catalytic subunit [Actibacterium lipolyticum]SMX33276.1 D-tagatose-1,6-bisphosphate aldolase subunit KbaZ [Actibacterium lipolyticum]
MSVALTDLAPLYQRGTPKGITSVCSAHPLVLRAALRHGRATGATVLIEATCNQVNHRGGYTDMTPADFAKLVRTLAKLESCPKDQIILGGDHLGPNPWRDQPADAAMAEAEKMIAAYAAAGFSKIHLDASMGCQGEAAALDDTITAERAARLARVAEDTASACGLTPPTYIIGTEVPPPGGADHTLTTLEPTTGSAAHRTLDIHRKAFEKLGLTDAFARVVGLVVQPGVEFGNHNIIFYDAPKAQALRGVLKDEPHFIFEAHSTDYQGTLPLSQLVKDGFPILKVGPELTFALREALYGLDLIATELVPGYGDRPLYRTLEALMTEHPTHWARHYAGGETEQRMLRHYSLSDRIRYYWSSAPAKAAVSELIKALKGARVPVTLFWQFLPDAQAFADAPFDPEDIIIQRIIRTLDCYHTACTAS